ncbi:MAG: hypothetical protein ACREL3_01725 [Gemmatimonadales bacterium]
MFIGHYGVSFAAKRIDPSIPLWVLFVAVQLLDVFWAPGMWLYFGGVAAPRRWMVVFGLVMLAIQAYIFFGPPPATGKAAAWTALGAYAVFAAVAGPLAAGGTPARAGLR